MEMKLTDEYRLKLSNITLLESRMLEIFSYAFPDFDGNRYDNIDIENDKVYVSYSRHFHGDVDYWVYYLPTQWINEYPKEYIKLLVDRAEKMKIKFYSVS